jgi:hypothetical protein
MSPDQHREKALKIERSLAKLAPHLVEIRIEAAMLAGTHWLNAALHHLGANKPESDVMHTYMLTVNEFRRLSAADAALVAMLAEIEDLRPLHVRGDVPGGQDAADQACALLGRIRQMAENLAISANARLQ